MQEVCIYCLSKGQFTSSQNGRVHDPWTWPVNRGAFFPPVSTSHEHEPCCVNRATVNMGCVEKKHCHAMLFLNTAREHRSCEECTRVHGSCKRHINQSEYSFYYRSIAT